ncbi:DUF2273 domain-containing protein [Solicola sp. PLA-1-18]|uniref:DUF2273 domain-containing protein n=1 Tax=Solicola sp. PLA-1-18 TaxID=3380532 RepID=UPI003B7BAE2C
MPTSTVGLVAGLLLALLVAIGGFSGLLLGVVLGAAGYLVGAQITGRIDLSELVRGRRD